MANYYKILGLRDFSSHEEVKIAYKKLSKKFHPDLNNGDEFFEELFKQIQNAYEILSDPKSKAIYDNKLDSNYPSNSTKTEEDEDTRSTQNTPTHYFTIGSPKDHVAKVQGTPSSISKFEILNKETWEYDYNTVEFKHGLVYQYNNFNGDLRVQLHPSSPTDRIEYFTVGSLKDVVIEVQGTPDSISKYESLNVETWKYGYSTIKFKSGRVDEYNNSSKNLKVQV